MKAIHFQLQELVDKATFDRYGAMAWDFLDPEAVQMLDGIREFFGQPVTVNNWHIGGPFQYRGYRPPECTVGAKGSYHRQGMAFDFDVKGFDAEEVRQLILAKPYDFRLNKIKRLEGGVSWVHADTGKRPEGTAGIYVFHV